MSRKPETQNDDEAARLLDAYLHHVETEAPEHKPDEKIVLVLPDAEVAERTRNAIPTPVKAGRKRKRSKNGR